MACNLSSVRLKEITEKDIDGEGDNQFNRNARGPSLPVEHLQEMLSLLLFIIPERHRRKGFKKVQGPSISVWLT